jgi:thiaminase/transcriptional activator TenA
MATVGAIIGREAAAWAAATRHPFLDGVRDGALPAAAFAAWLVQDYRFVGDLLACQARLLARAPRPAQAVLAAGLVGLEAELTWFEEQAGRRALALDAPRLPATAAYRDELTALERAEAPVALAALWAIERAYLDAWRGAAPGAAAYRAFVEHWTTPAFAAYVDGLERAADAALAGAGRPEPATTEAVLAIARLERDFWEMAWTGR